MDDCHLLAELFFSLLKVFAEGPLYPQIINSRRSRAVNLWSHLEVMNHITCDITLWHHNHQQQVYLTSARK